MMEINKAGRIGWLYLCKLQINAIIYGGNHENIQYINEKKR